MANDIINFSSDESNDATDLPDVQVSQADEEARPSTSGIVDISPGPSSTGKRGRPRKKKSVGKNGNVGKATSPKSTGGEQQAKKQKLQENKVAKKMNDDLNKIYKPGECMKYMTVEGHPNLLSLWWCADIHREVTATGAKVVQTPQLCHPSLVVWTRTLPRTIDKDSGEVKLTPSSESCGRALYVTTVEEIAEYVHAHSLAGHLAEITTLTDCHLTLLLFGYKDYFQSPRRKTSNSNRTPITDIELELALTDLMVGAKCDTVIVNTPNELARYIVMQTKAIAEAPHKLLKRACDDNAQFYMRGESRKCVAVDKNGTGVSRLWQQMIAILPHSSLETSRALCAKYKSPLALFEALETADSEAEIADIKVSRAAVPGSKGRRLGPEFARKLRILFSADDASTLVN